MKKLLNKKVIAALVGLIFALLGAYGIELGESTEEVVTEIAVEVLSEDANEQAASDATEPNSSAD